MANWISSKLKVAENFFEQIDQQAADSLKKERSLRSEDVKFNLPTGEGANGGGGGGILPLKDQLKRKTTPDTNSYNGHEYIGKLKSDPNIKSSNNHTNTISNGNEGDKPVAVTNVSNISAKPKPTLSESDWTELLSSPIQAAPSSKASNGALSVTREARRDGRKLGNSRSNLSVQERKKNMRSSEVVKSKKGLDVPFGNKLKGTRSDEDGSSSSSARSSSVELLGDGKVLGGEDVKNKDVGSSKIDKQSNNENERDGRLFELKHQIGHSNDSLDIPSVSEKVDRESDEKKGIGNAFDRLRNTVKGNRQSAYVSRSSVSSDMKNGSSTSDEGSDSDSDSASTSDSESEQERERREKILIEKAAARAVEAIKELENMVARLEGEKQSLEKILEERAKQQVQEASELQTTMMETMDAVEMEKQKHNNTRMEALTRLAALENANADLARALASAQKNLEVESNRVAELRQQCEFKEVAHEELRRKISKAHHARTCAKQAVTAKGPDFEREILEAEYSFITDKIGKLEAKAKELEVYIEMTRKDMEEPTEVEIELKRRLAQLTDHLIQKQAQVEVLSSEKATLLLRTETISRSLEENKPNLEDPESGPWDSPDSKLRPLIEEKFRSGKRHLGSLVRQLDAIFIAGAVHVRRNPTAKLWSVVYLVCLHFWVIYIFLSNPKVSDEAGSGAVISLANINNSSGV